MGQGRDSKKASGGQVDAITDSKDPGGASPARAGFGQSTPKEAAAWGSDLGGAVEQSIKGSPKVGVSPDADWTVEWDGKTWVLTDEEYAAGKALLAEGLAESYRIPLQGKIRECRSVHRELAGIGSDFGWYADFAEFLGDADELLGVERIDQVEDELNKFLELGYSGELYKAELQLIEAHSQISNLILELNAYGNRVTIGSWSAIAGLTLLEIGAFAFCSSAGAAVLTAEYGLSTLAAGGLASGGAKFLETLAEGIGEDTAGAKEIDLGQVADRLAEASLEGFLAIVMDVGLGAIADVAIEQMLKSDLWRRYVVDRGKDAVADTIMAFLKNMGSEVSEELYHLFLEGCAGGEPTPQDVFDGVASALVDGAIKGFLEAAGIQDFSDP